MEFISNSVYETEQIACKLAKQINNVKVIAFFGDLGAGKTAFTRGFASGLGIADDISSPTFAIVNEYHGNKKKIYHFDMYRINNVDDLFSIGFFDYLDENAYILIEWSENIIEWLPNEYYSIKIEKVSENKRKIIITEVKK